MAMNNIFNGFNRSEVILRFYYENHQSLIIFESENEITNLKMKWFQYRI
jgi:hypothetical protein